MKPTSAHSFPDADIVDWKLSDNSLEAIVSQVLFDGKLYKHAKLVFPLIKPATAMYYDYGLNCWIVEKQIERLKNISALGFKLEISYSLRGIGAESGKLIALKILSRNATITWIE